MWDAGRACQNMTLAVKNDISPLLTVFELLTSCCYFYINVNLLSFRSEAVQEDEFQVKQASDQSSHQPLLSGRDSQQRLEEESAGGEKKLSKYRRLCELEPLIST